jgi:uncharacterized protein (DUF58 family)
VVVEREQNPTPRVVVLVLPDGGRDEAARQRFEEHLEGAASALADALQKGKAVALAGWLPEPFLSPFGCGEELAGDCLRRLAVAVAPPEPPALEDVVALCRGLPPHTAICLAAGSFSGRVAETTDALEAAGYALKNQTVSRVTLS